MATATSPNIGVLNTGGLMPRLSSSGKSAVSVSTASRGSSPLERVVEQQPPRLSSASGDGASKNNLMLGMPAEHSTPQPSMTMTNSDSRDGVGTTVNPRNAHHGSTGGFASLASFAGSILSSTSDETSKRQKLEKYKKKLKENLAEQEAIVNKRIAAASSFVNMSSSASQRDIREFEQKIHVLSGKAQKLGRSIAAVEAQLAAPQQSGALGSGGESNTNQANLPNRPSTHSLGKATGSTSTPPNQQSGPEQPTASHHPASTTGPQPILQRAASSSSSHSQTHSVQTGGPAAPPAALPAADHRAATLPAPSAQTGSRPLGVLKDMKESITSTFRLRPNNSTLDQISAEGRQRKFGSADNLHQLNSSNISSSSGSCETAGSGAAAPARSHHGGHHPANTTKSTATPATQTTVPAVGVFEKTKSQTTHPPSSHSGVSMVRLQPGLAQGEKNAGTLPARRCLSLSVPPPFVDNNNNDLVYAEDARLPQSPLAKMLSLFSSPSSPTSAEHAKSFKYVPTGENEQIPGTVPPHSANSMTSGVHMALDEQTTFIGQLNDDAVSQMTTGSGHQTVPPHFSNNYHNFHSPPQGYSGAVLSRELSEIKELKSEVENLRHQLQTLDRHWNEKMEHLRLELTDVKYHLHLKPSHDDIQTVNRRCEDYSAASQEAVEHLRSDVIVTKSELSRQDQDLDNAIERLRRRVEELDFDAVATRLTLVEAKVSQVSNYVPGPEPSLRNVAAKLLNVLFALVALFLLLISTAVSMAAPFIRTRIRMICSVLLALILAVMYHFWLWRLFADEETGGIAAGQRDQL